MYTINRLIAIGCAALAMSFVIYDYAGSLPAPRAPMMMAGCAIMAVLAVFSNIVTGCKGEGFTWFTTALAVLTVSIVEQHNADLPGAVWPIVATVGVVSIVLHYMLAAKREMKKLLG